MKQFDNWKAYIKKVKREKILIKVTQGLILLTIIALWQILTSIGVMNAFIYSSPLNVIQTVKSLFINGDLITHIWTTLYEIIIAFILGISLGFIIAIIFYRYPFIAKVFDPFLTVLNSLPKVAIGPIIIIIAGANMKSIILMALFINLIVSIISIYSGFLEVDKIKLKMFKTFNASKRQILYHLVIPSSYNSIISSLKLNISLTLIGVITGEFLVSKKGLGYLIIYGTQVFNLDLVISGIIILLIISYLLYKSIIILEKKLIKKY